MKITTFLTLLLITNFSFSQSVNYNDVAVIINDNSQASIDIGNYFRQARNIPNQNMIHVFSPNSEGIDSLEFEQLRAQIENHLVSNNLTDSINYLVTTKGVPLKMVTGCSPNNWPQPSCGSVDAELTLILGQYANEINTVGGVNNPYWGNNATDSFDRSNYDIYLVTRLDGYTTQDVFNLIDRSGPNTGVNKQTVQNVVDLYDAVTPSDSTYFRQFYLEPTFDFLSGDSWNTLVDYSNSTVTDLNNVFCCVQQAYQGPSSVNLNYTWAEASIAISPNCATAATFNDSSNTQDYLLLADLIKEGCTGGYGNIGSIFFSEILPSNLVLERYLDTSLNYNLAESFYAEIDRLSRHSVIIGDPKTSIVIDNTASLPPIEIVDISLFPNPSNGVINIRSEEMIQTCDIVSLTGRRVHYSEHFGHTIELSLDELPSGVYLVNLTTSSQTIQKKIVLTK